MLQNNLSIKIINDLLFYESTRARQYLHDKQNTKANKKFSFYFYLFIYFDTSESIER